MAAVHAHVYPVDSALTPEEAWKELCIFRHRVTYSGGETWAVMECDGDECELIESEVPT